MRFRPALSCVLLCLAGCRQESPEAQIQKAFAAAVEALEAGDAATAVATTSPGFSGPEGMSRDEARLYLTGLLRQEKVGITVLSSRIEVRGARGSQAVEVLLTSRSGGGLLPQDATRRTYRLDWERLEGHWRLRGLQEP